MKWKWVAAFGFWILLYASVKLFDEHSWIGPLSAAIFWLFLLAILTNYGIAALRSHSTSNKRILADKGYPRWFLRFAYDEPNSVHNNVL